MRHVHFHESYLSSLGIVEVIHLCFAEWIRGFVFGAIVVVFTILILRVTVLIIAFFIVLTSAIIPEWVVIVIVFFICGFGWKNLVSSVDGSVIGPSKLLVAGLERIGYGYWYVIRSERKPVVLNP